MQSIKKIFSIFWAVIFLLSGFGFTISKMICMKSGKTLISLSAIEDCCTKSKKKGYSDEEQNKNELDFKFEKSGCCDISNTVLQLQKFQTSKNNKTEATVLSLLPCKYSFSSNNTIIAKTNNLFFAPPPPRLHGKTLLNLISVLTI